MYYTYTEKEIERLLEIQRGNCYVAVLNKCRDEEIAHAAILAPEPGGDQWKKNKTMNNQFLDFERSFKLWELRYAEPFLAWYSKTRALFLADVYVVELDDDKQIRAVLMQQAFDWFRERGYDSWSYLNTNGMYSGVVVKDGKTIGVGQYEEYKDSENARIDKMLELIKEKVYKR